MECIPSSHAAERRTVSLDQKQMSLQLFLLLTLFLWFSRFPHDRTTCSSDKDKGKIICHCDIWGSMLILSIRIKYPGSVGYCPNETKSPTSPQVIKNSISNHIDKDLGLCSSGCVCVHACACVTVIQSWLHQLGWDTGLLPQQTSKNTWCYNECMSDWASSFLVYYANHNLCTKINLRSRKAKIWAHLIIKTNQCTLMSFYVIS